MNPKNVIPTEIVFSTNFGIQVLPSKLNINEFIYLHIQSQILNYKCTGKVGPTDWLRCNAYSLTEMSSSSN